MRTTTPRATPAVSTAGASRSDLSIIRLVIKWRGPGASRGLFCALRNNFRYCVILFGMVRRSQLGNALNIFQQLTGNHDPCDVHSMPAVGPCCFHFFNSAIQSKKQLFHTAKAVAARECMQAVECDDANHWIRIIVFAYGSPMLRCPLLESQNSHKFRTRVEKQIVVSESAAQQAVPRRRSTAWNDVSINAGTRPSLQSAHRVLVFD